MVQRSESPFDNLPVDALRQRVRSFLCRLIRDPHAVDDVLSETLSAWVQAVQEGRAPKDATAWCLRVAWNKAVDFLRLQARSLEVPLEAPEASTGDARRLQELKDWLDEGLRRIPPADRAILHLRHAEELTDQRIALVLQMPRGTVAWRLSRARRRLGAVLERIGGGVPVGSVLTLMAALSTSGAQATTLAVGVGSVAAEGGEPRGQEGSEHADARTDS